MTEPDRPAPPLAIRLFGPFDVSLKGEPLPRLRSQKGQWLLALLVLRHGSDIERSWLAGLLWPDSPEPQALANLRNSLTDLRRALGEEAARLRTPTTHTLSLDLSGAEVDVVAFDTAIARGDGGALEHVVGLYRGPLLEGCVEPWAFQERQAREQEYMAALERLAAEAAERGEHAVAERYLRAAVAVDMSRETAQRALMRALAASGNYAAASQAFRDLRLSLHRELNAEPDPETRTVFEQIRADARRRAAAAGSKFQVQGSELETGSSPTLNLEPPQALLNLEPAMGREDGDSPATAPPAPLSAALQPGLSAPGDTLTFLFTDIEGSTRLWEQYPDAMYLALTRHDVFLRAAIETNNGHVFKTVGDAFCAAFHTAADALDAAIAAQKSLRNLQPPAVAVTAGLSLRVRMALHTGAADHRDGDYFGPPLNRVARLLAAGHGGQILLSLATTELVWDDLPPGTTLRDLGEHRLGDLQRAEHVFQVVHPELAADFPPLNSLESCPNNLPVHLTSFIGRQPEIAEVKRMLAQCRLLTLVGAGGIGKTRLALQVAADLLPQYPDGVWLVDLAALSDPSLVPQTVAAALRVREAGDAGRGAASGSRTPANPPILEPLVEHLKPRKLLMVLDNCEHVVAQCAQLAEALLRACPDLQILATSREALHSTGEVVWRVPSLSIPDAGPWSMADGQGPIGTNRPEAINHQPSTINHQPSTLLEYASVRLFVERARVVLPAFDVTRENAPALAQVCSRLDGIPLAIELAAARVNMLPVEQIAARLHDRFRFLTGGSRTALPRQQTLRAAIDWSYDLLSEPERTLLRRLSVFLGGFTLEAAEAICAFGARLEPEALSVEKGMVGSMPDAQRPTPLFEEWEVLDLLSRLLDKSLVLVEEVDHRVSGAGDAGPRRYRLLETVWQYARERLMEAGEAQAARRRHRDWYLALAERAGSEFGGPNQRKMLEELEAEHDNLRAALEWCLEEGRSQQAEGVEAALRLAAVMAWFWESRGYLSEGRERLAAVLSQPAAGAPTTLRAGVLQATGDLVFRQGDYPGARALYEESLAICRKLADRRGMARALQALGVVAAGWQSDYAAARSLYMECLAIRREMGDRRGVAYTLEVMGNLERVEGRYAEARALYEESLALFRELGHKSGIAVLLDQLGNVAWYQEEFATARALHEESLKIRKELGSKLGVALSLFNLGEVARSQGDDAAAQTLYEEALAIQRPLGDQRAMASTLNGLGRALARQGDTDAARSAYREGLTIQRRLGNKLGMAHSLESFAALEQAVGRGARAASLWGAAEALREAIRVPLAPNAAVEQERAVAASRAALGEDAFAAAWTTGRAMRLEEAVDQALENGG